MASSRETTFILRFTLGATVTKHDLADDDFEEDAWLQEWETRIKPGLVRAVFAYLRSFGDWRAHVRNRGIPAVDEVEIVFTRRSG